MASRRTSAKASAGSPHFDATGNGAEIDDTVEVLPNGMIRFGTDYSGRLLRQRFSAQKGETLELGRCLVTIEQLGEGDL